MAIGAARGTWASAYFSKSPTCVAGRQGSGCSDERGRRHLSQTALGLLSRRPCDARGADWVSKTDVIRYLRCPYTFWLIDTGQLSPKDAIPPHALEFIEESTRLRAAVRERDGPGGRPEGPARASDKDGSTFVVATMYNPARRLHGRPDGIRSVCGVFLPIQIKTHLGIHKSDFLKLAFDWLLLEPSRTASLKPGGYIIFGEDYELDECLTPIPKHFVPEVERLIEKVRIARQEGVRPRICGCYVCSQREEVEAAALRQKDISLLFNVGPCYSDVLDEMGINTYEQLMAVDSIEIAKAMRNHGYYAANSKEVDRWKAHARSWTTGAPVYFGGGAWPVGDSFVCIDLEYAGHVWCVGVVVVSGGVAEPYQYLWADSAAEEGESLRVLERLLAREALPGGTVDDGGFVQAGQDATVNLTVDVLAEGDAVLLHLVDEGGGLLVGGGQRSAA